jgi:hypothetical protein
MSASKFTARRATPEIFYRVQRTFGWCAGSVNFDLGSGPYRMLTGKLKTVDVGNIEYDPGWFDSARNDQALKDAAEQVDTVTLSNVLNVISTRAKRRAALVLARTVACPGGVVYITTCGGDRRGKLRTWIHARSRSKNCQLNRPLKRYLPEVRCIFKHAYIRGGMIVAPVTRGDHDAADCASLRRSRRKDSRRRV